MKDYKENKSNLSETFCNEVYSVVREIPAGRVVTYGDIACFARDAAIFTYGGACIEAGTCRFKPSLSSGSQCHRTIGAGMG